MTAEKKRLSLLVTEEIKNELEEFRERMGISQSAAVSMILRQYFDQQEMVKMVKLAEMESRQK